jgi:TolB-like protein
MRWAALSIVFAATTASAATPTVAVLPFRDLSGGKASVGEAIRETVTSDLKTLGGVRVVERAQLDRVLGEQHLQATDVDPATAARLGKLLGATLIAVGAYQQAAADVRLTARFVQVETGEIVGTAKVDGRASDFFRLQDKVTAELLRSAGLGQRVHKITERARAPLKSMHTLELYGDALVAENDSKKKELLEAAVAEDSSFTYAAADLAALEKRMKKYEALAQEKQAERTRALLDDFAKEKDPQKQATMAYNVLAALQQARRYRTLVAVGRSLATGPAAAAMPGGARVDEAALHYVIIGENMLKEPDAVLRDGEDYLRRFPTSSFFAGTKAMMDGVIREKHEVEEGQKKVKERLAEMSSEQRWNLCHVANEYQWAHQYREAQRLYHACFAVGGGVEKSALPMLIQADVMIGDWAAARHDLGELEKADPEMYRTMKVGYEMAIPSDV